MTRSEVRGLISAHIPSLTSEDEMIITDRAEEQSGADMYDPSYDIADLAMRTCACGVKLDGFYEYVDHLMEVFSANE